MTRILAIDPGNVDSAWCLIEADTRRPLHFGKVPNERLRDLLTAGHRDVYADHAAVEMVRSYGMSVGRDVFDTCVWIGRFSEAIRYRWPSHEDPELIGRQDVTLHHCHQRAAKDTNVAQALVDRFAHNVPNRGKGRKDAPGWFYGFAADVWQAYALAVLVADRLEDDTKKVAKTLAV